MDKPNLQLQELATLLSPIQKISVFEGVNTAAKLIFRDQVTKLRDYEEIKTREVRHIDATTPMEGQPGGLAIWIY